MEKKTLSETYDKGVYNEWNSTGGIRNQLLRPIRIIKEAMETVRGDACRFNLI